MLSILYSLVFQKYLHLHFHLIVEKALENKLVFVTKRDKKLSCPKGFYWLGELPGQLRL